MLWGRIQVQKVLSAAGNVVEPTTPLPLAGFVLEGHTHSIGGLTSLAT